MVRNSNAARPRNRCRPISHAVSSPIAAVSGIATTDNSIVVRKLDHAEPDKNQPPTPRSMENAVRK